MKKLYVLLGFAIIVVAGVVVFVHKKPILAQAANHICNMQLNDSDVTFCDTFDTPKGIGNRSGDLDGNVWGVSRATGGVNFGQNQYNQWNSTLIQKCDGSTPRVLPPSDIIVCNGQLREASNDNNSGGFEAGDVTVLAMYPKQPFDFAGRTGTVSFDISNDTHGIHAAWPEFWMSDLPIPTPFNHFDSWQALPNNGFGIRMAAEAEPGDVGECQNTNNLNQHRWTVDSAAVVRGYVLDDTNGYGRTAMNVTQLDCVVAPTSVGVMNHVELRISQNQIDVYATDAGTTTPLKHIAVVANANLTLSRGLIWLEDVHYNADKGFLPSQREHTFAWDNVAFDGSFTYRDFSYDALDATTSGINGSQIIGKFSQTNQTAAWNVLNIPANPQGTAVRVLFNFTDETLPNPTVLNVIVNGHAHQVSWPYPDNLTHTWRTFAVTVPVTDLVAGTNVVQIGGDSPMATSNVNIVLVDVPGGVAVLPGSNNSYPVSTGPTPTPTPTPTPVPTPTPTPTPPGAWVNVTGSIANLPSECGNLTILSAVPNSSSVIAGVAAKGYWSNMSGTTWTQLAGSTSIPHRPSWITYDPTNSAIFWTSGIYNNGGIYKTTNGGVTFTKLGTITHNDFVSVDFSDPNRQLILAGGHEQGQTVYKSTNGGSTWTNIGAALPAGTGFSEAPIIINSQTYIVNTDTSWGGGTPGIYRTTNGGANWTKVSAFGPSSLPLLAANGNLYWAINGGLAKSTDSGVTWNLVGSGLQNVKPVELQDGRLVAVGGNTMMISSDGGVSWTTLGSTLPFTPQSIVYSNSRKAFFISHWDCGNVVLSNAIEELGMDFGFGGSSPTPLAGDLNLDHIINSLDWSIMNSKWFTTDATADLNHDGLVNAIDFSILNSHWFGTW